RRPQVLAAREATPKRRKRLRQGEHRPNASEINNPFEASLNPGFRTKHKPSGRKTCSALSLSNLPNRMIRAGKIGMGGIFGRIDAWITTLILAVVMIAAWGVGFKLGHRRRAQGEEAGSGNFRDAAIALLGLLLAFTFSMSLGKYDYRRLMLVSDANSMGDF